jgi:Holliday junction resolvase RusA-like endonuclease
MTHFTTAQLRARGLQIVGEEPLSHSQHTALLHLQRRYPFLQNVVAVLDVDPCPAPRMTRSDKWKTNPNHPNLRRRQRPCVMRYFAWKSAFKSACKKAGFEMSECLNVFFVVPMPESWSKKKRASMLYEKHQQRPDRDNYLKAVQDAFDKDDGFVWDGRTTKAWGEKGCIIIYQG